MSDHVQQTFLDQVRRLPEATRRLLLAAADDAQRTSVILSAVRESGIDLAALGAAERPGLVRVRGGELGVRHPLVRSAVYQAATTGERQAAHRALAYALESRGDVDRLAWHRAWAVSAPDAAAAADLEQRGDAIGRAAAHARVDVLVDGERDGGVSRARAARRRP